MDYRRIIIGQLGTDQVVDFAVSELEKYLLRMDSGLTVDVAKRVGAGVLLRGVRGEGDVGLEVQLGAGNRMISGIETLVMFTDPRYGFISSSVVKDVLKHGGPIEGMVPEAILADVYARKDA